MHMALSSTQAQVTDTFKCIIKFIPSDFSQLNMVNNIKYMENDAIKVPAQPTEKFWSQPDL